jgi:5-formyltetrahydrofolate cyclo-ligase
MTKAELRALYISKRKTISAAQQNKWDDLLLIQFQRIRLPFINTIHSYLASQALGEIDTANIIRYLEFTNPGLVITVPKIHRSTQDLRHLVITENSAFTINKFGIEEPVDGTIIDPSDIDLVLTPLLAFDSKGYRVGYGKGFYDRFFPCCRPDVMKIGLSYFEAEDEISNVNKYDVPLNYCVTPQKLYEF